MYVYAQLTEHHQCLAVDQGKVTDMNSKTKHLHCMLHRYALACKTLAPGLRLVLDDVVYMKSLFPKPRIFTLATFEKNTKNYYKTLVC